MSSERLPTDFNFVFDRSNGISGGAVDFVGSDGSLAFAAGALAKGGKVVITGLLGGTYSTPIINVPETAILLVGRSRKLPVVVGDQVVVRLMMPLSLSYDHRLIDGATAARFLNDVIGYLEAPSRLLLAL